MVVTKYCKWHAVGEVVYFKLAKDKHNWKNCGKMATTQRLNKAYMTIIMTAETLDWAGFPHRLPIDMYELYSSFWKLCYLTSTCKDGLGSQGGVGLEIEMDFPFANGDEDTSAMEIQVYCQNIVGVTFFIPIHRDFLCVYFPSWCYIYFKTPSILFFINSLYYFIHSN